MEYGRCPLLCLLCLHCRWSFDYLKSQPCFIVIVNHTHPDNMEVMPSKSVSNLMIEGRITKTTRILQFLIKICFIPVSVKNCKIVFQVFSLKILVYILCAVLWNIFTTRMMFVFMKQEDFDLFFSEVFCCLFIRLLSHFLNILFSKVRLKR